MCVGGILWRPVSCLTTPPTHCSKKYLRFQGLFLERGSLFELFLKCFLLVLNTPTHLYTVLENIKFMCSHICTLYTIKLIQPIVLWKNLNWNYVDFSTNVQTFSHIKGFFKPIHCQISRQFSSSVHHFFPPSREGGKVS